MPRSGPGGPTGRPLSRRSPAVAGSKPPRMCRNVLLPHPDGPTMETNSCSSIASDRRSIAVTLRLSTVNVLSRSVTSSSGIVTDLSSLQVDAKQCRALSALPSPLWGGVGGGGGALRTHLTQQPRPPSPALPRRKSGLPDLRKISRDPGKPGARGGGSRPSLPLIISPPRRSAFRSLRQVAEIDQRPHVGVLLLEAGLDLECLHLLERIDVDLQAGITIVIVHAHVNVGIDPHHLAVDQELAGLARAFQVERGRRFEVFEQAADRTRILLEELVLADQDDQLLLERDSVFRIEDLADLHLLLRERRERLRELPEVDLAGIERFLHRRERHRRDGDIGVGQPMLFQRGLQPQVARRVEAVDADDLALEIGDRPDRRAVLDVEAGAEAARAFAR